jgi:hypothetical protein
MDWIIPISEHKASMMKINLVVWLVLVMLLGKVKIIDLDLFRIFKRK